ncbi:hypothetical protein V2J09_021734 [Rumex salicifolius]
MAGIGFECYDCLTFLCDESKDLCFDDPEADALTDLPDGSNPGRRVLGSDPAVVQVPLRTDEIFAVMLGRECQYSPKQDYFLRLRNGDLNLNFRRDAFDWISKAHAHHCFRPLSLCLSMNYLDRFLSHHDLPKGRAWAVQLLAVACLSIAVKMDEINVPPIVELQVADPKYLFEAKTIQRMELLVLTTLNWQMSAITPFSFVDYFLCKINNGNPIPTVLINKAFQLILWTDFLEFKPSEIAAAVAITVAGEIQETVDIDKAIPMNVEKERVVECVELIKELGGEILGSNGLFLLPESPVGVLEAKCFSNASYDINVVGSSSCAHISSTTTTPDKKSNNAF